MLVKRLIASTAISVVLACSAAASAADTSANSALIQSEKLVHANVRNAEGTKLGEVEGVLLNKAGTTQAVIVDVGGFLGMGERRVALNWSDVQVTKNGDTVTSRFTKEQLKALPEYKYPASQRRETAYYDPSWAPTVIAPIAVTNRTLPDRATVDWHKANGDIHAKYLLDAKIRNPNDENIGDVDDAIIDSSGHIKSVIADIGGFLGMGSHRVALDVSALQLSQRNDDLRYTTSLTKDQLKALPEYKERIASSTSSLRNSGGTSKR